MAKTSPSYFTNPNKVLIYKHLIILMNTKNQKPKLSTRLVIGLVFCVFLFTVFGNIQCPLLWNDEGHSVMMSEFTAQFGYPKISDGKNIVYAYQVNPDGSLERYNERLETITLPIWAGYYWGIPPALLARQFQSPYAKTMLFRIWFALTGILGFFFLIKSALCFIKREHYPFLVLAFLVFSILNISIGLHLREVRYYSLMILLWGLASWLTINMSQSKDQNWLRLIGLGVIIALLFFTFHPLYFIFVAVYLAWVVSETLLKWKADAFVQKNDLRKFLFHKGLPVLISLFIVLPTFPFFQPFMESDAVIPYRKNFTTVIHFLFKNDFLLLFILVKLLAAFIIILRGLKNGIWKTLSEPLVKGSLWFFIGFTAYLFAISNIPDTTFLYTRYYLLLFPLMYLSGIFDFIIIWEWVGQFTSRKRIQWAVMGLLLFSCLPFVFNKALLLQARFHELTNCYKGPIDYAIPYLQERFEGETEDLVIATNYEEPVFMYFLNSKTTIGFLGNNLKEDSLVKPDVIIYRKHWTRHEALFEKLVANDDYERIAFPVKDIPINNLPQIDFRISHRFKTEFSDDPEEQFEMYILK